jgi:O-antigen/teichoic acid export membrane protein
LAATLANVLLNLWMIPRFGLMGAALSTVLGYALLLVFAWRQSLPLLNVRVDIGGFLRVLFSSATMALVVSFLPGDGAVKLILGLIVGATVYSTLILLIDRNLRNFLRTLITHQRPVEELL